MLVSSRHYAEGRAHLEALVEPIRRVFGAEHPIMTHVLNNLAGAARGQKDYPAAIDYAKRTIELRSKLGGPDNPETALARANLAGIEADAGRWQDSRADGPELS